MLNKDFDIFYDFLDLHRKCPPTFCEKKELCINLGESSAWYPGEEECKKCWRYYIEQQEPEEEKQPELFGIEQRDSGWISVNDRLPEKPGLKIYEHVECLIVLNGEVIKALWNCEHLVWDDRSGDDYLCDPKTPTYWRPLPKLPEDKYMSDKKKCEYWFKKRLAVYADDIKSKKEPPRQKKFFEWQKLPKGYRWF